MRGEGAGEGRGVHHIFVHHGASEFRSQSQLLGIRKRSKTFIQIYAVDVSKLVA